MAIPIVSAALGRAAASATAAPATGCGALPLGGMRVALAGLLLLGAAMRLAYVRHNYVVVDEFQHLHAAFLVAHGQTPYVSFFEHHTPLFYYLAAALLPLRDPSFETMTTARHLALCFSALTVGLSWWWVRRLAGRAEALVVLGLLVGNFFLFARGSLSYLDTYAAPLLILSAYSLTGSRGRPWRNAASAAALGIAILFTQKAVVAGLAPLIFFLGRAWTESTDAAQRRAWLRDLAAYALGGLAAAALLPILLGVSGLDAFWYHNVTLNLAWQARRFPTRDLALLAGTDGVVYALAVIGTVAALRALIRRRLAVEDQDVPVLYLGALGLGIFVIPVVWEEYFILVVPFAVIVSGITLLRGVREYLWVDGRLALAPGSRPVIVPVVVVGLCGVMLIDLAGRVVVNEDRLSAAAVSGVIAAWAVLGFLANRAVRNRAAHQLTVCLLLLLAFPVAEQADWVFHNLNDGQRARVTYVLEHSGPQDAVFDGYTGFGVFRPHAYRFWFLHEEVQAMLSPQERGADIVRTLKRLEPPIVIADQYVRALPEAVTAYIDAHYDDTPFPEIKRRRAAATAQR